ncbi:MAG: DUF192 domain-containing protein [Methanobrevibacter sp.]|jgi:uncharacterized membrane protein (UPF0127 family)|nr:DUF192 domain-containing protein [Candidatus Methanoflexus mossambicus]
MKFNNNMNLMYVLKNKNKIISKVKCGNSFYDRFKGLMFKKEVDFGFLIKIPKNRLKNPKNRLKTSKNTLNHSNMNTFFKRFPSSIHSFFMLVAIDIVFLDDNFNVVDLKTLYPWRFYIPKAVSFYVIELKLGTIKKYEIAIGNKLKLIKIN